MYMQINNVGTFLSTYACWCQCLHVKSDDNILPIFQHIAHFSICNRIKINHVVTDAVLTCSFFVVSVKVLNKVRLSGAPVLSKLSHPCSKQRSVYFMNQYAQSLVDTQLMFRCTTS